jgi:hypothetical protein
MGLSWDDPPSAPSVPDHEPEDVLAGRLMDELTTHGGCARDRYDRAGARRALFLLRRGLWGRLRYRRWQARPCPSGCGFWHLGPPRA